MHYDILTENQIENRVESAVDRLDRHLLTNQINQEQYDKDIVSIDKWASQQYEHLKNARGIVWTVSW
jgi:hypothetical protein